MRTLLLVVLAASAAAPIVACHTAYALEPARAVTPTVDLEIEDHGPDKSSHVARFSLAVIDGKADINVRDGSAEYAFEARTTTSAEPRVALKIKRVESGSAGNMEITTALPDKPNGRVLVARVDRNDGRVTSIVAQIR